MAFKIQFSPPNPIEQFIADVKVYERATVNAINKVALEAKKEASQIVRAFFNVPASDVTKSLSVIKSGNITEPAYLVSNAYKIPFINFPYKTFTVNTRKGKRKGVLVNRFGTFEAINGGFLATMKSGHTGIFGRKTTARLPIKEKFSSSIAGVFNEKAVQDQLTEFVETRGPQIFEAEFRSLAGSDL